MNQVKENMGLKVTAIIMLVGGIISAVLSLTSIAGVALLNLIGIKSALIYIAIIVAVGGSVVQIVAGANGIKAAKDPTKAPACVKLGVVIIALNIFASLLNIIAGNGFDFTSLALGLILPCLYTAFAAGKI